MTNFFICVQSSLSCNVVPQKHLCDVNKTVNTL